MSNKKVLAGLLCALVVVCSSAPVLAKDTESEATGQFASLVSPRMSLTDNATSTLRISGSTASVTGIVKMAPAGKRISMTTSLLCNGRVVNSWSTPTSTTSTKSTIQKSVKLTTKGTYQVKTEYTVYGDSGSESGTSYSGSVKY